MQNLEIKQVVIISTGHVSAQAAQMLNDNQSSKWPCVGGPYAGYGWFIYAHDDNAGDDEQRIPDELFVVMTWARQKGAEYVLFDRDAERVEGLPYFEW